MTNTLPQGTNVVLLHVAPPSPTVTDDTPRSGDNVPTTATLAHYWVDGRRRRGEIVASTATTQRDTLRGFAACAPADPSRITKRAVERWMATTTHLAPGTRRTRWSTVRCFLRWLQREGHLKRDPMAHLTPPKVPRAVHRALASEQVEALLRVCEDQRDRLIITLGWRLGLRRAEIAGLEVGDINPGTRCALVTGKGGHERHVPLTRAATAELDRYLSWAGVTAGPLLRLPRYPERGVSAPWVGRRVTLLCYAAGIKARPRDGVSTHALRHSLATDMHESGASVLAIRDVLGHRSLVTTEIYVRGMGVEQLRAAMEAS